MRFVTDKVLLFTAGLLIWLLQTSRPSLQQYRAPDRLFAIQVPADWTAQREMRDAGWVTTVGYKDRSAGIEILATPTQEMSNYRDELKARMLREVSQPFFQGWYNSLRAQVRTEITRKVYHSDFAGARSLRMDVRYFRNDNHDPRQGFAVFFFGQRDSYFIVVTGFGEAFREANQILSTFVIEPKQ
jgi:hypothetical protein